MVLTKGLSALGQFDAHSSQLHTNQLSLRPLTRGKCFLLFLPDSHSAYYDSLISALGRSLPPPHWVFQGFVALGQVSGGNGGRGGGGVWGGLTHPRLQHWVKWLWERVCGDFSALGGPTSSVSRRLAKLTIILCHCRDAKVHKFLGVRPAINLASHSQTHPSLLCKTTFDLL